MYQTVAADEHSHQLAASAVPTRRAHPGPLPEHTTTLGDVPEVTPSDVEARLRADHGGRAAAQPLTVRLGLRSPAVRRGETQTAAVATSPEATIEVTLIGPDGRLVPQAVVDTDDLGAGRWLLDVSIGRGARVGLHRLHVRARCGHLEAESSRIFCVAGLL